MIYPVQLVVPASDAVLILSLMHVSFQLGGGLGGGFAPPPQAQHMALDVKSASSYEPHQEGLAEYSAHVSPYGSVAPLSVLLHGAADSLSRRRPSAVARGEAATDCTVKCSRSAALADAVQRRACSSGSAGHGRKLMALLHSASVYTQHAPRREHAASV